MKRFSGFVVATFIATASVPALAAVITLPGDGCQWGTPGTGRKIYTCAFPSGTRTANGIAAVYVDFDTNTDNASYVNVGLRRINKTGVQKQAWSSGNYSRGALEITLVPQAFYGPSDSDTYWVSIELPWDAALYGVTMATN
jgi:hypothetical protein